MGNIAKAVRSWVGSKEGRFTVWELDHALGLETRQEKNARARALRRMLEDGEIEKDRYNSRGIYFVHPEIEWIDLDEV